MARVEVEDRHQHEQRSDHGVEDELDRRVDAPVPAPDPDDEVHRDQHHLPHHVEEEQVEGQERAQHAHLEHEERDQELLDLLADGGVRRQEHDGREEGGEQHQPQRDAVDAELEVDADAADPLLVDHELEAALAGVEPPPHAQGREEGAEREAQGGAAQDALLLARDQHEGQRAEERQEQHDHEDVLPHGAPPGLPTVIVRDTVRRRW